LFGLPGALIYKAVNTADSMIGHRTMRHEAFGWASARLDDLLNLPAARVSALLVAIGAAMTGASFSAALSVCRRDARAHASPNAGWPEAAMAGALDLRLGGPRAYGAHEVDGAWFGSGRAAATPEDIRRALRIFICAAATAICVFLGAALLLTSK
jgi:adenosylcobinamide-phosphate synthase